MNTLLKQQWTFILNGAVEGRVTRLMEEVYFDRIRKFYRSIQVQVDSINESYVCLTIKSPDYTRQVRIAVNDDTYNNFLKLLTLYRRRADNKHFTYHDYVALIKFNIPGIAYGDPIPKQPRKVQEKSL